MYVPIPIFFKCFGFVIVCVFLLLCFLPREVPLAFVVKVVWWCWTLSVFFFFKLLLLFLFYLFIYLWLCWVFVSVRGLSLVVASGDHSSSQCAGLSLSWPLLLRSTGSRRAGSVVVAHGPSCSAACGIFPDQGSNPCPLHSALAGRFSTTAPPGKPWTLSVFACL